MILVDTSIWIDHLGRTDSRLQALLDDDQILAHPYVIGEIALGAIPQRDRVLKELELLPKAIVATHPEFAPFVDRHQIHGAGVGYVDAHLLISTFLTPDALLWTRDKRLFAVAQRLAVAADIA